MKTTLTLLVFLITFCAFSQETSRQMIPIDPPTNSERYGIDYEIKNYIFANGDSTVLNLIDLNAIENQRSQSENVEIIDATTGLTIILFFEKREKNTNHLNQKL